MSAYDELYLIYGRKIFRFLNSLSRDEELATELTQETFYQAFLHFDQFKGKSSVYTWLCQIGKNAFFKECKRRNRLAPVGMATFGSSDEFVEQVIDRDNIVQIHEVLNKMDEPYREVFILKVYAELKFREISAIFDKSESWAKLTYYRAKEKIVRGLEEPK